MNKATARFWKCFEKLPTSVKTLVYKNYSLLQTNPKYPSLHFKKIGNFWSIRIGNNHRALAIEKENNLVWVWIGTHEEYNKLI